MIYGRFEQTEVQYTELKLRIYVIIFYLRIHL